MDICKPHSTKKGVSHTVQKKGRGRFLNIPNAPCSEFIYEERENSRSSQPKECVKQC